MTVTFQSKDEGAVLRVVASGVVATIQDLESIESAIVDVVLEECAKRILLDELALDFDLESPDMATFADQAGGTDVPMAIHVACLANEQNLSLNKKFEKSYANHSVHFKVFEDEAEAFKWLIA